MEPTSNPPVPPTPPQTSEVKPQPAPNWDQLPPMPLAEASWLAGVSLDSFERIVQASGMEVIQERYGQRLITLQGILRVGFSLLGQRESQLAMLRIQLERALAREKELTEALQSGIALDDPLKITTYPEPKLEAPDEPRARVAKPAKVKAVKADKKRGKKKKRRK